MRPRKQCNIKHLAFQIVAQLPEEVPDALRVLEYARRLLVEGPSEGATAVIPLKVVARQD